MKSYLQSWASLQLCHVTFSNIQIYFRINECSNDNVVLFCNFVDEGDEIEIVFQIIDKVGQQRVLKINRS